jgi:esterase/lipase
MLVNTIAAANTTPAQSRCAYVLHGLNTNPKRMEELAEIMRKEDYATNVGVLAGHHPPAEVNQDAAISSEQWRQDLTKQWTSATSTCPAQSDQRIFVAYSLGAITGLNVFDSSEGLPLPTKMILISPALALRKKTYLIRALSWLPFGSLPSLNHPDYRAKDTTPLSSYKALFQLHDQWQKVAWKNTGSIKTLVVLDPEDELVDSQKADSLVKTKNLKSWTLYWTNNESSKLKPKYHHLIIDARSQGQEQWDMFSAKARKFIQQE